MPDIQLFKYFESIDDPSQQGIPRHDTIARVMSRIDMTQFQDSFSSWMKGCSKLTHGDVVAIDGKRLKVSFNQSDRRDTLYIVSAFACDNGVVLAQSPVNKKSNEIKNLDAVQLAIK